MKILIGMIAAVACFMLVDTMTCNSCPFALAGICASSSTVECSTNSSQCFTSAFSISSLSFKSQGCIEGVRCNMTSNSTILGVSIETKVDCCTADRCNTLSGGAPSAKLSFGAVIGAAILASVWGNML